MPLFAYSSLLLFSYLKCSALTNIQAMVALSMVTALLLTVKKFGFTALMRQNSTKNAKPAMARNILAGVSHIAFLSHWLETTPFRAG